MKVLYRLTLALLLITVWSTDSVAQNPDDFMVDGNFSDLIFRQFVNQIEAKTSFRFYYDPAILDSLKINLPPEERSLTALLSSAFKDTDIRYVVHGHSIYVVKGRQIQA